MNSLEPEAKRTRNIYGVSETKAKSLLERMQKLSLLESDLEENFIKGSGKGGQKINKTSSCVQLLHKPTGIELKCQESRSRALNRYYARIALCEKIEEQVLGQESAKKKEQAKIRKQKQKRSKRAKDKMLEGKRQQSEKKERRKKPGSDD